MSTLLTLPVIHYAASRFGWPALKRAAYDAKYQSGDWSSTREEHPQIIQAVAKYSGGGRVAVLGCGLNSIGTSLQSDDYSEFVGIDLSEFAVKSNRGQRLPRQYFFAGDMTAWQGDDFFDVVVFHESIYYLSRPKIIPAITNWKNQMNTNGVVIVTIAQADRYSWINALIREKYHVLQEEMVGTRSLLVFR